MKSLKHIISLLFARFIALNAFIVSSNGRRNIHAHTTLLNLLKESNENDKAVCSNDSSFKTRRFLLSTVFVSAISVIKEFPSPAIAAYGESSSMGFPSYYDFLVERNTTPDDSEALYKGADRQEQIKRIIDASIQLKKIPSIAQEKKWSQVQGILTGPLGTFVMTMNTLSKESNDAKKASAKVKADILSIGQAASKKNADGCIKATDEALNDLESFVKVVF